MDDEEIIVKAATIISTFRIMFNKDKAYVEVHLMDKLLKKNIDDIFTRIGEDDESLLILTKELGKIYYCIHKFYPATFECIRT